MKKIGIELLTVFDLPPVEFVELVSRYGFDSVSLGLNQFPMQPFGYEPWTLRDNPVMQKALKQALDANGISISLGEGLGVRSGQDVSVYERDIELFAQLGAQRINTVGMDADFNRNIDQIGKLVDLARAADLPTTLEFAPGLTISSLPQALQVIEQVGASELTLLIDVMHFYRSGGTIEQLKALPPHLIGYVQLCDATRVAPDGEDYMRMATFGRKLPGQGELPLSEFLADIPDGVVISLEVPNLERAQQEGKPDGIVEECAELLSELLSR